MLPLHVFLRRLRGLPQDTLYGLLADRLAVLELLQLDGAVEDVQLYLHGLVGAEQGLLQIGKLLALCLKAVLAGIGVGGIGGKGHRGHHAELLLHLLLVQSGALDGLGHPAAALLLKPLEVLLHLVVDGLGVVEQDLIALLSQRRRVAVHAVLVDGLQLYAVVDVLLALVKVGHLFPAKQAPALLLFLFAPLRLRGFGPPLLYHVLRTRVLRHVLRPGVWGILLLRLIALLLGHVLLPRLLGDVLYHRGLLCGLAPGPGLALLALLLENIFQCEIVFHGLLLSPAVLCRTAS